jgi:ankyrin repeat protein
MDQPAATTESAQGLAASFEDHSRRGGPIRIDVDAAGISRTDNAGQRYLRWTEVRVITRSRGQLLNLIDASRQHAIAIPRGIDDAQALLNTIAERLTDAHATRAGSAQDATFRQHRIVPMTILAGSVAAAVVCAWLRPSWFIEALLSVISTLAYLAVLPNRVVVGPEHVEVATPLLSKDVPIRAIRHARLLLVERRGPIIAVTLSGGASVELRGFGEGALPLYDTLRGVIKPHLEPDYVAVRRHVNPGRALVFTAASMALVALLIGLPIWNGRALSSSVRFVSPRVVGLLLRAGAPVEGRDLDGRTATYNAAKFGRIDNLRLLLSRGGDPARRSVNTPGHTPLHVAAEYDQEESVRALLAAGVDPNIRNNWDQTPLLQMMLTGQRTPAEPRVLQMLMAAGADVDVQDNHGFTALHAITDHPEMVDTARLLASRSANLNLRTTEGEQTAFDQAVIKKAWPIAHALAAAGARVDTDRPDRDTWLYAAVFRKDTSMARELLDCGARLDRVGTNGYLPLQVAALNGDVNMIELLIAGGARVDASTEYPAALHLALQR